MFTFSSFAIQVTIEGIAVLALIANIYAYRQDHVQRYRIFAGLAMLLLSAHFFCLEAYAASIGCGLAVVRNAVSLRFNGWLCTGVFIAINIACFFYEWVILKHDSEIFLAYIISIIFTIGTLRIHNTSKLKKLFFCAELLSIIYCMIIGSIFGGIYGLFNAAVILHWWIIKKNSGKKLLYNTPLK